MPETAKLQIEKIVNEILGTIDREREREIVARRFGLFDRKETLEQIGELLGITRERVRQLEKAVVARLKAQADGGQLPSARQITTAIEGKFVLEDWHNFGADYDRTLMAWWANFDAAWPSLRAKYGDRFYRMWRFYLQVFAAMFRARNIQLWQLVLSPDGIRGGYRRVS